VESAASANLLLVTRGYLPRKTDASRIEMIVFVRLEMDEDELRQKEATSISAENIATIGWFLPTLYLVVLRCRKYLLFIVHILYKSHCLGLYILGQLLRPIPDKRRTLQAVFTARYTTVVDGRAKHRKCYDDVIERVIGTSMNHVVADQVCVIHPIVHLLDCSMLYVTHNPIT
jgi:hypothetical protein